MFKFVLNYPDKMTHDQMRTIEGRIKFNSHEWLKRDYLVIITNIDTRYHEEEHTDEVKHEFILTFDLEPECYGDNSPSYHQHCVNQMSKFGQDIIVDKKYSDFLEVGGQLPNSYYFEEV